MNITKGGRRPLTKITNTFHNGLHTMNKSNDIQNTVFDYTIIKMHGSYYVESSVLEIIDKISDNKDDDLDINEYKKRIEYCFNRGYLYKDNIKSEGTKKNFPRIPKKIKDILRYQQSVLTLFYPKSYIYGSTVPIQPILVADVSKLPMKGGDEQIDEQIDEIISEDYRRDVYAITIDDLKYKAEYNYGKLVIKIGKTTSNSNAYSDEANIYEELIGVDNIVKYYTSGRLRTKTDTIQYRQYSIKLPKVFDENSFYIILENTYDYNDFGDYLNKNDGSYPTCHKAFNAITKILKKLNTSNGFFHGDLHTSNVKINDNQDVKFFDFDFSGIINSRERIISKNFLHYQLESIEGSPMFKTDARDNSIDYSVANSRLPMKENLTFLYQFDYFRLLLHGLLFFGKCKFEKITVPPDDDNLVFKALRWYGIQVGDIDWHNCFKTDHFLKHIVSPRADWRNHTSTSILNGSSLNINQMKWLGERVKSPGEASSFATGGGGLMIYNNKGKHLILLNNVKSSRIIYKNKNQHYIKKRNGEYNKIEKKNVLKFIR